MGTLSLTKENRLFWLGRYSERVYSGIRFMILLYDRTIDGADVDYKSLCSSMGFGYAADMFDSAESFIRRFTFDKDLPFGIRASAEGMLGNGMVLRETISSETLSYLQMAVYNIQKAEESDAPALILQEAIDNITAFRGSFDDYISSESVRNIIKTGSAVERLSIMIRCDFKKHNVVKDLGKLLHRLEKTDLEYDPALLEHLRAVESGQEGIDDMVVLHSVENLVRI